MKSTPINLIVVLGPTASGKTRLGARLAHRLGGEVVSADSRQVYRGLTIGTGKDLAEYTVDGAAVPYHLIDIVGLDHEFSVFEYQQRFFEVFNALESRKTMPVLVGGTGLYLDAVLRGYRMVAVPENAALRAALAPLSDRELVERLQALKERVHNTTDLTDRARLVRAIEIATFSREHAPEPTPEVQPLILGTRWPREELHRRIRDRLQARLQQGLLEEVETLLAEGVSWDKLDFLGLEYRFVGRCLRGELNRDELLRQLGIAIGQFAKRQETWFRRMERQGTHIHWIDRAEFDAAWAVVKQAAGPM